MLRLDYEKRRIEEQFRLVLHPRKPEAIRFEAAALADPNTLAEALNVMAKRLRCDQPPVLGSLFVKYYARILCGVLYAMSRLQLGIPAAASDMRLEFDEKLEPLVVWQGAAAVPCPTVAGNSAFGANAEARHAWRARIVKALFADNLEPLIRTLASHVHLNLCTLWENVVIYVHYFYQRMIDEAATEAEKARIRDDYAFVTQHAGCELFGACTENPLNIPGNCVNHPLLEGQTIRVRRTCCLRCHLPDGRSCTTCPRLSENERRALLESAVK